MQRSADASRLAQGTVIESFGISTEELGNPIDRRAARTLAAAGYADRMVLAHDASCRIDWFAPDTLAALAPDWHFTFIPDEVLPALRAAGVTDPQVDAMLVDTPRRHLTGTLG